MNGDQFDHYTVTITALISCCRGGFVGGDLTSTVPYVIDNKHHSFAVMVLVAAMVLVTVILIQLSLM